MAVTEPVHGSACEDAGVALMRAGRSTAAAALFDEALDTLEEIGQRLFVSRRTVQTHLSHAFRKLDVRSRVELAGLVARRGGIPETPTGGRRGRRRDGASSHAVRGG